VQNYSSSYTVTGSTLTLASAPPLNSKIDVRFLGNAAGGGGGGSSLHTGSKYPITSSWATRVLTASYALNFGNSVTQSFNNLATWTFNHNLGERTVVIQAYNTSYNQIIPQSIILDTVNSARLTFPISASGYAIATRGGVRIFSSSYGYYNLNTGSTYPITSSWAVNAGTRIYTSSKYPITSSWAFKAITASYANNFGNSVTQSFGSSTTWNFTHSLGQKQVVVQAYNNVYELILPTTTKWLDANHIRMIFPSPVAGTAIATMGGLRVLSSSYKLYTGSTYPITSSWSRKAITASVALNLLNSDSVSSSFNNSPTWTFNHNLGSKPVLIQTYNNSFNQVLPQTIVLTNLNTATITFPVSSSGYAIATRSGLRTIPAASNLATTGSNNFKNSQTISNGYLILSYVSASLNFANDASASIGGVPLGGVYRNGNILQIRIT
jgi:hypothetical protein